MGSRSSSSGLRARRPREGWSGHAVRASVVLLAVVAAAWGSGGIPFEVVVEHADGSPVHGATLWLSSLGAAEGSGGHAEGEEDGSGRYRFDDPFRGPVRLSIWYGSTWAHFEKPALSELPRVIRLPGSCTLVIDVKVEGDSASPESVSIEACAPERPNGVCSSFHASARLENGRATLVGVPAGDTFVSLYAPGFPRPGQRLVNLPENACVRMSFTLDATTSPVVIAVVAPNGAPVQGAEITVRNAGYWLSGTAGVQEGTPLVTGPDGCAVSYDFAGEHVLVEATAEGFARACIEDAAPLVRRGVLRIALEPGSTLAVRVRGAGGRPVAGASVSIHQLDRVPDGFTSVIPGRCSHSRRAREETPAVTTVWGPDGQVSSRGHGAGTYRVTAIGPGGALGVEDVVVGAGREAAVEVVLRESRAVRGTLSLNGRRVEGGLLSASTGWFSSSVDVDAGGAFELRIPLAGEYRVDWHAANSQHIPAGCHRLEPGRAFRLDLETFRLSGRVVGPDGEPVPWASGGLIAPHGGSYVVWTDAEGRFAIENLIPGRFALEVWDLREGDFAPTREVEVAADTDVVYRLLEAQDLTVRFADDRIADSTRTWLRYVGPDGASTNLTCREARGAGGEWALRVRWPREGGVGYVEGIDVERQGFSVSPGETEIALATRRGGWLIVHILDVCGDAPGRVELRIDSTTVPLLGEELRNVSVYWGELTLHLPTGNYDLRTLLPSGRTLHATAIVELGRIALVHLAP